MRPLRGYPAMMSVPPVDPYAFDSLKVVAPEHCNLANTWHRSRPSLQKLRAGIAKFGNTLPSCPKDFSQEIIDDIVDSMLNGELPQQPGCIPDPIPLKPYRMSEVISHPDYPSNKSPGLGLPPDIRTKKDYNNSSHYMKAKKTWSQIGRRAYRIKLPDAAIHSRVIPVEIEKDKVRPVWAYPVLVANEEARFFYAIMDRMKHNPSLPYSLGLEPGVGGLEIISHLTQFRTILETDWSSFDTNVPAWLIRMVFSSLKRHFAMDKSQSNRFETLVDYFINTPFRLPNGERYMKSQGVPSGSFFTNLVDTIANAAVTRYLLTTDGIPTSFDIYNGDDGYISLEHTILPDAIPSFLRRYQRRAKHFFGFELSIEKTRLYRSTYKEELHFYGYDAAFTPHVPIPQFQTDKLFASLLHPDRKVKTPIESCARTLGLLQSSFGLEHLATPLYNVLRTTARSHHLSKDSIVEYTNQHLHKSIKHLRGLALGALTWPTPTFTDERPWSSLFPSPVKSKYYKFTTEQGSPSRFISQRYSVFLNRFVD
jgi:hypothetical protein